MTIDKELINQLAEQVAANGGQLTNLRRIVLEYLLEAKVPVKAYTIIEDVVHLGHRLTPTSIYRTLGFLRRHGLVHKVNALNAYVACSEREANSGHQPLILVCPECQKTAEINDQNLSGALFAKLQELGYATVKGAIEVHGQCAECAGKCS